MPGMNSGPAPGSPILVSAFQSAFLQQWLIVALIFALLLIAWGVTAWDYPPVQAASASVWIQMGIGLWMLLAMRGWAGRGFWQGTIDGQPGSLAAMIKSMA